MHVATERSAPSILHVEDNWDHAYLFRLAMERDWPDVALDHAVGGPEAIDWLEGHAATLPDMILLDLRMPGMDGHELLGILSSRPAWRNIPVMILTTSRNPDDRLRITEKQVIGYLTKPHDLLSFNTVIRELRQKWRSSRGD